MPGYPPRAPSFWRCVLVGLVAFLAVSCGRTVEIVVPNGFTGDARLIYDPQNGVDPESHLFRVTYRIPASGELAIRDQSPLYHWHAQTVMYTNGHVAKVSRAFSIGGTQHVGNTA